MIGITILNALEQHLKTEKLRTSSTSISLENYTNGVY